MADQSSAKGGARSLVFTRNRFIVVLVIVFFAGILFTAGFQTVLTATNRMEFCTSCHSMKTNLAEFKESVHYRGRVGSTVTCADCHVPKEFFPKMKAKILAVKDIYHELMGTIDTPEKYEARRWEMASAVWAKMKARDSHECRNCHSFQRMDLSEQSRSARRKHERAVDDGMTCIDCHHGITHEEPLEPDEPESEG